MKAYHAKIAKQEAEAKKAKEVRDLKMREAIKRFESGECSAPSPMQCIHGSWVLLQSHTHASS